MDDLAFDRLVKLLNAAPSRRSALGLVFGTPLAGLARLLHLDNAEAKKKGKGKGKGKKKGKKKKPKQEPPVWRPCGGCNVCQTCVDGVGQCLPDPSKNGLKCSGCHTCNNGACNAPDDALCRSGERCQPGVGLCCPECQSDGSCCPVGSICINPGLLTPNFCCDTDFNHFCGSHGDGTFKECCPRDTHRCLDDQCVPNGECPDGWKLCPGRTGPFCTREEFACCGDSDCNTFRECCDASQDLCCLKGRCICPGGDETCTGGRCCPHEPTPWIVCGHQCCNPHTEICCGGDDCCSAMFCVGDECCPNVPCGAVGADNRVCPTDDEFCCEIDPRNPTHGGYACPRGDEEAGVPDCAAGGRCCPAGTLYDDECDACCVNIFAAHCRDRQCVPATPGRFPA